MNKQEFESKQKRYIQMSEVFLDNTFELIDQIDEPQKVVIPKFVAEYIEMCKQSGWHLVKALSRLDDDEKVGDWAYNKNDDLIPEKLDIFARAWLDGYEVKQDKLYTVEIPDPNSYCDYRYLSRNDNGICLDASNDTQWKQRRRNQFTESEIKQDFEWAWQFAEEVEVKND